MTASPRRILRHSLAPLALVLALPACSPPKEIEPITESRELSPYARKPAVDIPSATRFFAEEEESPSGEHPLVWKTPDGWTEKPVSQMRLIDLSFGPEGEGECYLSALPGPAGGLAANINRWRGQVGAVALTDEEIVKLPRKPFLGSEALFVSVDGDFKGMGDAADAKKDYRLLGIIHQSEEITIFIKMTGPKALVEANSAAFDAFCQSVDFRKRSQKAPPQ